ncbi:MAG: major outer membrane protein [Campylobacterota bacterium]
MKKFAKISLAAAVAVAGLSSVASAKPLEEAIKGVDATGYVTYQYNDRNDTMTGGNSDQDNTYKAGITLTVPATDDVKVKVAGSARGATDDSTGDVNVETKLTHAHFIYTGVQNLTVIAGKQALNTPWTQGSSTIDPTQIGSGVLALYNAGFATLAAGHIVNSNITIDPLSGASVKPNDITVAAAIVPMGDVATAQVWYADVSKDSASALTKGADALSVSADVNLMDVAKLAVAHSTFDTNGVIAGKGKLTKAVVSGSAGPVNLALGYGKTGKEGNGIVAFDNDGSANFLGWDVGLNGVADASAYLVSANMDVLPALNVGLTHVAAKQDAATHGNGDLKWNETYASATYTFAANLYATVMLGQEEMKDNSGKSMDDDKGRLEIGFKF